MRGVRIALISTSALLALLTVLMTLLLAVSREVNSPPYMITGFWASVFVAGLGVVGIVLLFTWSYGATVALGLAAGATVVFIPSPNWINTMAFAIAASFALLAYILKQRQQSESLEVKQRARV